MIKGDIGYFGLTEWWINSFSETERKHIVNTYNPFMLGSQSLTKGDFENTKRSQSIINFLVSLSGWFSKAEDIQITIKIFEKIEQLVQSSTSYIDLHFFYLRKIEIFYKHRNIYPNALIFTIDSCKKQIEISEKV